MTRKDTLIISELHHGHLYSNLYSVGENKATDDQTNFTYSSLKTSRLYNKSCHC